MQVLCLWRFGHAETLFGAINQLDRGEEKLKTADLQLTQGSHVYENRVPSSLWFCFLHHCWRVFGNKHCEIAFVPSFPTACGGLKQEEKEERKRTKAISLLLRQLSGLASIEGRLLKLTWSRVERRLRQKPWPHITVLRQMCVYSRVAAYVSFPLVTSMVVMGSSKIPSSCPLFFF